MKYQIYPWPGAIDFPTLSSILSVAFLITALTCQAGETTDDKRPIGIWRDPVLGMAFVEVPGGCFQMGGSPDSADEEFPHEVCLDNFWIGRYEVTQGQWRRLMGNNPAQRKKSPLHPVEKVSMTDVQAFIDKLSERLKTNFRLPTEAEWEYACRSGGENQEYAGVYPAGEAAWVDENSGFHSHPVGKKRPNGLGLYDMSGNLWEWTQDLYAEDAYLSHTKNNPVSRRFTGRHSYVARGGSWGNYASSARCAFRVDRAPKSRFNNLGFRLVADKVF